MKKDKDRSKEATTPRKTSSSGGGGGHVAELANKLHKDGGIKMGPPARHVRKGTSVILDVCLFVVCLFQFCLKNQCLCFILGTSSCRIPVHSLGN